MNTGPPVPAGQPDGEPVYEPGHSQVDWDRLNQLRATRAIEADEPPEPVPAGQHAPPAGAVEAAAQASAAWYASLDQYPDEAHPSWRTELAALMVAAAAPHIAAAQRAADEAEFAARIAQLQDATQGIVQRAVDEALAKVRKQLARYQFHERCINDACSNVVHVGLTLPESHQPDIMQVRSSG